MKFNIELGNCADCDLTLTLFRGEVEISQFTEPANSINNGNDFTTDWDITVSDSIRTWLQDTQTSISISYSVPAEGGAQCLSPIPGGPISGDCSGNFRMYYSDEGGEPGDVYAEFPVYVSLTDREASGDLIRMNSSAFFIPFFLVLGVLGITVRRERWNLPSMELRNGLGLTY